MLAKEMRFIERFKAQAAKAAQVQSRVKKLDKIEKVEPPKRRKALDFEFPPAPRSGEDVAKIERVRKALRRARHLRRASTSCIRRKERWAVMGVNGAGKSTLLKLIAGETAARRRARSASGPSVQLGYFAQHAMELLDPRTHRLRVAGGGVPAGQRRLAQDAWPAASASPGDDVDKTCRILSGGEKARLVLARILYDRPNFLVLDEPTNHLDMATKDMLVRALGDYEGTMLFVSHDRQFLAQLSNRVLELGPDGPHRLRRRLPRIRRPQRPRSPRAAVAFRVTPALRVAADRRRSPAAQPARPAAASRALPAVARPFRA